MNAEELKKGKQLAEKSLEWWSSTMPGFEQNQYVDEPIPLLVKWLKQHAFPQLEKSQRFMAELVKARKIVAEIAADNLRDHISHGPRRKK